MFNRIAIGTANWKHEYNGSLVSEKDQQLILDYCQSSGIDMLDCATAYGTENVGNSYFKRVVKVCRGDDIATIAKTNPYCIMAHGKDTWSSVGRGCNTGVSLYRPREYNLVSHYPKIVEIPYSIYDRSWEHIMPTLKARGIRIHVRSIFLRGRILKETKMTPRDCIDFCLMNPYIDRVIIGVDSFEQLQSNLRHLHRMNSLECRDENIIDTRKWKDMT